MDHKLTHCTCDVVYEPEPEFLGDPQFRPYQPTDAEAFRLQDLADQYARGRRAAGYTVTRRDAQHVAAMRLGEWELADRIAGRV